MDRITWINRVYSYHVSSAINKRMFQVTIRKHIMKDDISGFDTAALEELLPRFIPFIYL